MKPNIKLSIDDGCINLSLSELFEITHCMEMRLNYLEKRVGHFKDKAPILRRIDEIKKLHNKISEFSDRRIL